MTLLVGERGLFRLLPKMSFHLRASLWHPMRERNAEGSSISLVSSSSWHIWLPLPGLVHVPQLVGGEGRIGWNIVVNINQQFHT